MELASCGHALDVVDDKPGFIGEGLPQAENLANSRFRWGDTGDDGAFDVKLDTDGVWRGIN